eukprot:PITA_21489
MDFNPQMTLQPFEKWAIDFVGPIKPQGMTCVRYIITTTEYLTRWAEAQPVKDYTVVTTVKFLFEHVVTRFGYPKILMSDCGTHFLNETFSTLMKEFQAYHQKSTSYHPQASRTVEEFKKVLENMLTKLVGRTPFTLVYGVEAIMPMEYIMPSLCIVALTGMTDRGALEERLVQLEELEEERFLVGFH